jgi:signal transduction histidine kinase
VAWLVILLAILAISAIASLLYIKVQMRRVIRQLDESPVREITLGLVDKDLTRLAISINKITAAHKAESQRSEQRERQLKEDISNISHDLRTPLTSVCGYIQLLDKTELDDTQREYVRIIADKAEILAGLIHSFYDVSYWNQENSRAKLENVNLSNFVSERILACQNDFESKGVSPILSKPLQPVFCYADIMMLTRIFQNLVINALEYGQGNIEIAILPVETGMIALSIRNALADGEPPDPDRVFDRFYTGDAVRTKPRSGLGLSVVKLLAEKMGGTTSAVLENGVFVVELRLRRSATQ